ncbi:DUF6308 family protein [Arthrobacter sp. APC 3897]|uniref:DUF6308 family protein n=1 Tax=Arthrobacter sp. APC 3897 TaxID=3035204 RepID=UPI0033B8A875
MPDLECAVQSLAAASMAAIQVKWWTAVSVSKVLHRRRPHIVPLIDSRIKNFTVLSNPSQCVRPYGRQPGERRLDV